MSKRLSETAMLGSIAESIKTAAQPRAALNMKLMASASTAGNISVEEMLARSSGGGGTVPPPLENDDESGRRIRIDPAKIAHSRYANRLVDNFKGPDFEEFKAEIVAAGGNVQPIKVRKVAGRSDGKEYEIVYGHRRNAACLQSGISVNAIIEDLDDRALFVEMDQENRGRKDLSAWEQGLSYVRALDQGLFPSARKLSEAVGGDLSNVGKAISLARLPPDVVEAFSSPFDIQYRFAKPLRDALDKNPEVIIARAKAIKDSGQKLPGAKVVAELLSEKLDGGGTVPPPKVQITAVMGVAGQKGEIQLNAESRSAVITLENIDPNRLANVRLLIEQFLSRDDSGVAA